MPRLIFFGLGNFGGFLVRHANELKYDIVGAFNRSSNVGEKLSQVLKLELNNDVKIGKIGSDEDEEFRKELMDLKADVAIHATTSQLKTSEGSIKACLKAGINVITLCDEAFFPNTLHPEKYKELDDLAKANNVTLLGTGLQDIYRAYLPYLLISCNSSLTKMTCTVNYNINKYASMAPGLGMGITREEFIEKMGNPVDKPATQAIPTSLTWLCHKKNWDIVNKTLESDVIIAEENMFIGEEGDPARMEVEKGKVAGTQTYCSLETKQGILLEIKQTLNAKDPNLFKWDIEGIPKATLTLELDPVYTTVMGVFGRLNQVLTPDGRMKGFINTAELGYPPQFQQ